MYSYDPTEHHAAPVELRWVTRARTTSLTRWVFIRCCGALGNPYPDDDGSGVQIVRSVQKCRASAQPAKMHPGNMELLRVTSSSVRKHGNQLPMARWQCCGREAIHSWDACWDLLNQGRVPEELIRTGCRDWDTHTATQGICLDNHMISAGITIAKVARPSVRRSSGHGADGPSSGLEQLVLQAEVEVPVADLHPTQGFVCLDTFDAPGGKRNVFDFMLQLCIKEKLSGLPLAQCLVRKLPTWPPVRIARHPDSCKLFCCDNRRLFILKVLGCQSATAMEVAWMKEFDDKLRQAPPKESEKERHWRTDAEGIQTARIQLERKLCEAMTQESLRHASAEALITALIAKDDEQLLALHADTITSFLQRVTLAHRAAAASTSRWGNPSGLDGDSEVERYVFTESQEAEAAAAAAAAKTEAMGAAKATAKVAYAI